MNSHDNLKGAGGLLGISWHDTQWIPILNATNILDYFSERSNPFYDKTCNNEIIKMQRLNPSHLNSMDGVEYMLLHVQEPILYVIRKQHRHASTGGQVTPLADYYCIAGVVYQAPDLGSIVNSRIMNTINHLQSAFSECLSYTRYHPSKGYSWEFNSKDVDEKSKKKVDKVKEEPSSVFQRVRVDILLGELTKKYAPRIVPQPPQQQAHQPDKSNAAEDPSIKTEAKETAGARNQVIKQEPNSSQQSQNQQQHTQQRMRPPPEKKPRLM